MSLAVAILETAVDIAVEATGAIAATEAVAAEGALAGGLAALGEIGGATSAEVVGTFTELAAIGGDTGAAAEISADISNAADALAEAGEDGVAAAEDSSITQGYEEWLAELTPDALEAGEDSVAWARIKMVANGIGNAILYWQYHDMALAAFALACKLNMKTRKYKYRESNFCYGINYLQQHQADAIARFKSLNRFTNYIEDAAEVGIGAYNIYWAGDGLLNPSGGMIMNNVTPLEFGLMSNALQKKRHAIGMTFYAIAYNPMWHQARPDAKGPPFFITGPPSVDPATGFIQNLTAPCDLFVLSATGEMTPLTSVPSNGTTIVALSRALVLQSYLEQGSGFEWNIDPAGVSVATLLSDLTTNTTYGDAIIPKVVDGSMLVYEDTGGAIRAEFLWDKTVSVSSVYTINLTFVLPFTANDVPANLRFTSFVSLNTLAWSK